MIIFCMLSMNMIKAKEERPYEHHRCAQHWPFFTSTQIIEAILSLNFLKYNRFTARRDN